MDITPSSLSAFFSNLRTDFQSGLAEAPTFYEQFCTVLPSSSEQNIYGWMDFVPQLRQWVGERYVRNVVSRSVTAVNLLFEDTLEVQRTKLEDDQYALYGAWSKMLGRAAKIWPDAQVVNLLTSNPTAYDGVSFFSGSHPKDPSGEISGTQSNDLSLALSLANFATALQTGKSYVGRDNAPIGVFNYGRPILMVGPALEKTARDIIASNFLSPTASAGAAAASAPSSNVFMGMAEIIVNPFITSATAWYLIDTSMPIRPIIWQLRSAPSMVTRFAENDPNVFERDMYQMGVRARGCAVPGLWFGIIRGNS